MHFPSLTHSHIDRRGETTEKEYLSGAFLELLYWKLFHKRDQFANIDVRLTFTTELCILLR